MIFNILWEMVVSANIEMKISAANLLKVIVSSSILLEFSFPVTSSGAFVILLTSFSHQVPYIDAKVASTHVLPALVTLGSDQNLNVKYASIDAFGAVALQFKNDTVLPFLLLDNIIVEQLLYC